MADQGSIDLIREALADHMAVADDEAADISEALEENIPWDPPDHPQAAP